MFTIGVRPNFVPHTVHGEDESYQTEITVYEIAAAERSGRNFYLVDFGTRDEAEADAKAAEITASGSTPETQPDAWREGDPSYGTDAWTEEAEHDLACFEADCFGEPRPTWF